MERHVDLTGRQFGLLEAIKRVGRKGKRAVWLCRCQCEREIEIPSNKLTEGKRQLCHRLNHLDPDLPMKVHRLTWASWQSMKSRCIYASDEKAFRNYGGRGIRVCDRWLNDFAVFLADMGERPSAAHSIERKDVNGHYEPGNCVWATVEEQARNRRDTVWVEWKGEQRRLMDVADEVGVSARALRSRLKIGWSLGKAIKTPVRATATGMARMRNRIRKDKPGPDKSPLTLELMRLMTEGADMRSAMDQTGATYAQAYAAHRSLANLGC